MSAHTPGPWRASAKQYTGVGIANMQDGQFRPPRVAAAITGRSPMDGGEGWHCVAVMNDHAENEADARLIAAAPELLDALRRAEQFITNGIEFGYIRMPESETPDTAHQTPYIIRAAIAKAEGKQ